MASLSPADVQPDPGVALWARLADQRLHLRDTVSVHQHRYRGRLWFLLRDTLGKKQLMFKALGIASGKTVVADFTAGFGGDSFKMACMGFEVFAYES